MALRDQPYFPLYVQDYLTDEKLNLCSPSTQGVYIKILCIFHKSEVYGGILLKQKDKQHENICLCFAHKLSKLLPFQIDIIIESLVELIDEKVLIIDDNFLYQKRMVKDNNISIKRSESGKKGGDNSLGKSKDLPKQKHKQNPEYENEDVIDIDYIYSLYPSKCFLKNSSTGKCDKNKEKIKSILKTKSKDELSLIINTYVSDCKEHKVYLKNFSTFLNNLPNITESNITANKMCLMTSTMSGNGKEIEKPYSFYEKEFKDFGPDNVKLIRIL